MTTGRNAKHSRRPDLIATEWATVVNVLMQSLLKRKKIVLIFQRALYKYMKSSFRGIFSIRQETLLYKITKNFQMQASESNCAVGSKSIRCMCMKLFESMVQCKRPCLYLKILRDCIKSSQFELLLRKKCLSTSSSFFCEITFILSQNYAVCCHFRMLHRYKSF